MLAAPIMMAIPTIAWPMRRAPSSWRVNAHMIPPRANANPPRMRAVGPLRLSSRLCSGPVQGIGAAPPADAASATSGTNHTSATSATSAAARERSFGSYGPSSWGDRRRELPIEHVGAARVDPGHAHQVGDAATGVRAFEQDDQVNRLDDQRLLRRHVGTLCQAIEPQQRTAGSGRVDRTDAAGMARGPGVQKVQGLGSAYLAHDDPAGARAERTADQLGERHAGAGPERQVIASRTLQFHRVLEHDDPLVGTELGDRSQQGVGEGRLAGIGATGDEDVAVAEHGTPQRVPPYG